MTACGPDCPVVKEQLRNLVEGSPWLQKKYGRKPGESAPPSTTPTLQEVATSTPSIHPAKEARPVPKDSPRFPDGKREDPEGEELQEERTSYPTDEDLKKVPRVPSERESRPDSRYSSDSDEEIREIEFDSEPRIISAAQSRSQRSYVIEDSSKLRPGEFKREPFIKHKKYPSSPHPKKIGSHINDSEDFSTAGLTPAKSAASSAREELQLEEDLEPEAWEDSSIPGDRDFDPIARSTPKYRTEASREPRMTRRTSESGEVQDFYEESGAMGRSANANLDAGPSKISQRNRRGKDDPVGRGHKPSGKDDLPSSSNRQPNARGSEDPPRPPPKRRTRHKPGDRMRESELCELKEECDFDNVCLCRMHCVIRGLKKYSFVRSMITAAVLFTIGLKLCAELDSWRLPTPVG